MNWKVCLLTLPLSSLSADWTLYKPEEWFDLNAHLRIAGAASSGNSEDLATHGHDPNAEFTVQGFEIEPRVRFNDHILIASGFNVVRTPENDLEAEFEEGYGSFQNLPGGFEVRGGRFFNRLGLSNSRHLHAWDFVDSNLLVPAFLSDENLATDGVEVNWFQSFGRFASGLTASFGEPVLESEEEEEEEEASLEEGNFAAEVFTARWLLRYDVSDFHSHQLGFNFARGRNGFDGDTEFYGIDYRYLWRENGLEPGGQFAELGSEFFFREVDVIEEDLSAGVDHFGFSFSAAATYYWELSDELGGHIRLQGNFDDFEDRNEQSVFLQLGFDYGGSDGI